MCNGARTQSFRTRSSRSERRAHLCERIYALNISKTKTDIEIFSWVKSVLFLIFHRKTSKNRRKKNFFFWSKIFQKFFLSFFWVQKKKFFFSTPNRLKRTLKRKKKFFLVENFSKIFSKSTIFEFLLIITQKLGQISKNVLE